MDKKAPAKHSKTPVDDSDKTAMTRIAEPKRRYGKPSPRAARSDAGDSDETLIVNAPKAIDADKTVLTTDDATRVTSDTEVVQTNLAAELRRDVVKEGVELDVGSRIRGRFVLKQRLGEGGMGSVFKALDLRKKEAGDTNPYIAIKLLNNEFEKHPKAFVSLQREAKKTQELAHPNIVTVYDFDRDGSAVFLTMEELHGWALKDVMRGKTEIVLTHKDRLRIIEEIAQGLAYAHSKGIVHSDLKPANIFYCKNGRIKILDFGIARAANEELYQDGFDAGELGALTYPYASPEMIRFEPPHPSDDIYALGIISAELLGAGHPFKGMDAKRAEQKGLAPNLPKLRNKLLVKQVRNALLFDRTKRTQDAAIFLKRFQSAIAMPMRLGIVFLVLLAAGVANYFYIQSIDTGVVEFSEIPIEQQEKFRAFLDEGRTALRFKDLQGAVINFNEAFKIHGTNSDIIQAKEEVIQILDRNIQNAESTEQRDLFMEQREQVKNYEAFAEE